MRKQTLILIAMSFTLAIVPAVAFGQGGDNGPNALVGFWQIAASNTFDCVTGKPDGEPPVPVNYLFNQGGTMTEEEANLFDGPYRASAQGIWKHVSGRKYQAVFTNFAFNPDRTLAVTLKFKSEFTLDKDGDSFTERGTADIRLPNGTSIATVCYGDIGTRMRF